MDKIRKKRDGYRTCKWGLYHLCTDGLKGGLLFNTQAEYAAGMTTVAIAAQSCGVRVCSFELMPNHVHIILSGTGAECCDVFLTLKRRISSRLLKDGYPPLPVNYDFVLIPIENESQLRNNILYVARNPYEKGLATPGCYPWGSGRLNFSSFLEFIDKQKIETLPKRERQKLLETGHPVPGDWFYNRKLGILPESFVDLSVIYRVFTDVKDYFTSLVKEYEAFAKVASVVGEEVVFSGAEVKDILNRLLQTEYGGRKIWQLEMSERYRLAGILSKQYSLAAQRISAIVELPLNVVKQVLSSKEHGTGPRPAKTSAE